MRERIEKIVLDVLNDVKVTMGFDYEVSGSMLLLGDGGCLDSMGIVNMVVDLEEMLQNELEVSVVLLSDKAFSEKNSPFRSVQTLTDYIMGLINE